jgi:hypothetical protein
VKVECTLTDASGRTRGYFTILEVATVHVTITNSSGMRLPYSYSWSPIFIEIQEGDSIIATSLDGLTSVQMLSYDVLEVGHSIVFDWAPPQTPWNGRRPGLNAGLYKAAVRYQGLFDRFRLKEPESIEFRVYPGNV